MEIKKECAMMHTLFGVYNKYRIYNVGVHVFGCKWYRGCIEICWGSVELRSLIIWSHTVHKYACICMCMFLHVYNIYIPIQDTRALQNMCSQMVAGVYGLCFLLLYLICRDSTCVYSCVFCGDADTFVWMSGELFESWSSKICVYLLNMPLS